MWNLMRAAVIVIFGGMCAFYEAVEINKHYCHMLLCTYERKHAHVCVCVFANCRQHYKLRRLFKNTLNVCSSRKTIKIISI